MSGTHSLPEGTRRLPEGTHSLPEGTRRPGARPRRRTGYLVLLVAFAGYLIFRLVQGILWITHHI